MGAVAASRFIEVVPPGAARSMYSDGDGGRGGSSSGALANIITEDDPDEVEPF